MSLRKNTLIVFLEKHSVLVLGFISTLILARLLTPEEVGLFSVAMALAGIAHMFRDFGIGQYLIQEKNLNNERVQSAFTITLIIAWSLSALLYFSSYFLVNFYHEPRLEGIIKIMSISFLMLPFGSIGVSLLRREMLFKRLYIINTIPQVIQTITSIALAYLGFSYMSLVYANLIGTSLTVILSMVLAPSKYKPGINFSSFKHVASYSTSAMSTNLLIEINGSAPDFILSRTLGFDNAAIYSRAKGVLSIFYRSIADALRTIALPEIARRIRDEEDIQPHFYKSMNYITVLAWPFYGFLFFKSTAIILLLYGDQWIQTSPVLSVLALVSIVGIVFAFGDSFIISLGLQHHNLHYQFFMTGISIIWLITASSYGLVVIALGFIVIAFMRNLYMYTILKNPLSLNLKTITTNLSKSFIVTCISLLPCSIDFFTPTYNSQNIFIDLFIQSIATGLIWLLALTLLRHPLYKEIPFVRNLKLKDVTL